MQSLPLAPGDLLGCLGIALVRAVAIRVIAHLSPTPRRWTRRGASGRGPPLPLGTEYNDPTKMTRDTPRRSGAACRRATCQPQPGYASTRSTIETPLIEAHGADSRKPEGLPHRASRSPSIDHRGGRPAYRRAQSRTYARSSGLFSGVVSREASNLNALSASSIVAQGTRPFRPSLSSQPPHRYQPTR